jgi:phosphatidylglycerol:prolipoprotein diacylglycerol transferase
VTTWLVIPWFRVGTLVEIPLPGGATLPLQAFGLLVATGVLVGARVAEWFAEKRGVSPYVVSDMAAHVVLVAFVCAYFLNAAFYDPELFLSLFRDPGVITERYLGLSSYGGFIGAVLGALLFVWRRKLSFFVAGDAVAFGFPFGWLFGRTGCFLVHDHPGRVSTFFLAVDDYQVPGALPPYPPRHDLGLYEVIWSLAVIALFLTLARRPLKRGSFVALLALTYAPVRFFLDFLRAPPELGGDVRYAGLTPAQWGSVGLLLVGVAVALWLRSRPEVVVPAWARWPPPPETDAEDEDEPRRPTPEPAEPPARESGDRSPS